MSKLTTKAIAKVAAVATGLGMATSLLSLAPMAHAAALTQGQIDSIVSLLQSFGADSATIANVKTSLSGGTPTGGSMGGSTSSSCNLTMDLHTGSSGVQVTCLQNALIAAGYPIAAGATGYFGTQTQVAVKAWQAAHNVAPAAGYFGSISRGVWATSMGGGTPGNPGTPTTPSTLTGSGRLTQESSLGDVTTSLYAGDAATAVVGDSFVATGGDVQVQRVDATFDLSGVTTGSTHLDQYVKDVQLWIDGKKVATMDAAAGDFTSSVTTFRFTGLSNFVKKGDMVKIHVKVTPLSSVANRQDANGSFAGTMTAKLLANSIRAIGGDSISDTYVATAITQNFSISSAITATLTTSPASSNPVASQILTSSSTKTGVKLLAFTLKAKNSDTTVNNLRISLNTSDNNLNDVVNTVYLQKGSTVLKSSTLSTGSNGVVTFTNLNEKIAKDAMNEYQIVVDLKAQNTAYVNGTTLVASTTVAGWDVTDSNGNSVSPSAAVAGNIQTLTGSGLTVVVGTPTKTDAQTPGYSGQLTSAQFTIPFTVTAGDTPIWIGGSATATTSTTGKTGTAFASNLGVVYATTTTSSATTTTTSIATVSANPSFDSLDANSNFYVAANASRSFVLNLTSTASVNNQPGTPIGVGFQITGINYDTSSTMGSTYYTSNITTFKTPDSSVQKGS